LKHYRQKQEVSPGRPGMFQPAGNTAQTFQKTLCCDTQTWDVS